MDLNDGLRTAVLCRRWQIELIKIVRSFTWTTLGNFLLVVFSLIYFVSGRGMRMYWPIVEVGAQLAGGDSSTVGVWDGTEVGKLGISQGAISLALYFYILLLNGKIEM